MFLEVRVSKGNTEAWKTLNLWNTWTEGGRGGKKKRILSTLSKIVLIKQRVLGYKDSL